jgi:hypothetical protein
MGTRPGQREPEGAVLAYPTVIGRAPQAVAAALGGKSERQYRAGVVRPRGVVVSVAVLQLRLASPGRVVK